jgi:hypothetical protein
VKPTSNRPAVIADSGLVLSEYLVRPRPPVQPADPPPLTPAGTEPRPERKRLSGPDRNLEERLLPFCKHWPDLSWDEDWRLYWAPASFENRSGTKPDPRFLQVFESLIEFVSDRSTLRGFTFFDTNLTFPHLIDHMILNAIEYLPMGAIGFCPGEGPAGMPSYDGIKSVDSTAAYEKLKEKNDAFRIHDIFPRIPKQLHYIMGDQDSARHNLTGRGGFTYYLSRWSQMEFSELAKLILVENTSDPIMRQMPMPVPLLNSASFTRARAEQLESYFQLFDLYVAESPTDNGILIAATLDLDDILPDLIERAGYRERKRRRGPWRVS